MMGIVWLELLHTVGLAAAGMLLALQINVYFQNYIWRKLPPGPFPFPFLGNYLSILKFGFSNTHELFESLHQKHGHIYTFWNHGINMKPVVSVNSPTIAESVLKNKKIFASRGPVGWESFIPNSLLILPTNKQWSFHRRLVAPCFSEKFQELYFDTFQKYSQKMMRAWRTTANSSNITLDAHNQLIALTLDVIGKCAFGQEFNTRNDPDCEFAQAGKILSMEAVKRTYEPKWMRKLDRKRNKVFKNALSYYHKMVGRIRSQRRSTISDHLVDDTELPVDMLSAMIRAKDKVTGIALSDKEVVDQITTFLLAGHETTSNTLSWALHLLSIHPKEQEKLREEVIKIVGADSSAEITYDQCKNLKYSKMVICETLRLYPVLPRLLRQADSATKILGFDIPKGTRIRISLINMHRSPEIWGTDAADFRPERFNNDRYLKTLRPVHSPAGPFSYLPFGAGVRTCIGSRFAMAEAVTVLSNIIRSFSFEPADPNAKVEMKSDITMGPKDGLLLNFYPLSNK